MNSPSFPRPQSRQCSTRVTCGHRGVAYGTRHRSSECASAWRPLPGVKRGEGFWRSRSSHPATERRPASASPDFRSWGAKGGTSSRSCRRRYVAGPGPVTRRLSFRQTVYRGRPAAGERDPRYRCVRVLRSPARPWRSIEYCQARNSSTVSVYRLHASSSESNPPRTAATTSALRRGTHRLAAGAGRSAIVSGPPSGPMTNFILGRGFVMVPQ
jgi:hypothetical protein